MRVSLLRWIILIISFAVLTFGGFIGIYLGDFLPTFSCYFIGQGNGGVCFLYPLQSALESGELYEYTSIIVTFLLFSLLIVVLGRMWCGWICPLGFVQDVLDWVRRKVRLDYIRFPKRIREQLISIKWIFLFVTLLVPLWVAFPFFALNVARDLITPFCDWCPARYIMPLIACEPIRMGIDFQNSTVLTMSMIGAVFSAFTIFWHIDKSDWWAYYEKLWPKVHNKPYVPGPGANYVYNILYGMGIYANVEIGSPPPWGAVYPTFDDAVAQFKAYVGAVTPEQESALRKHLPEILVRKDNGAYTLPDDGKLPYAMIWWDKKGV